jgi:hypothetical protein
MFNFTGFYRSFIQGFNFEIPVANEFDDPYITGVSTAEIESKKKPI